MERMIWLALAIGNSRLHWAWFSNQELQESWHSAHLSAAYRSNWPHHIAAPPQLADYLTTHHLRLSDIPIYLASVVPAQTAGWQNLVRRVFTLADLPLPDIYPTLGIDRALAAYGAGEQYGYPVLTIDAGTALTVTGIAGDRRLVGGAIWPGLNLQLQSLGQGTAALPLLQPATELPPRWAQDTATAIWSGVIHGAIANIDAFVSDWQQKYPTSAVAFTGGDGQLLHRHCQQQSPATFFSDYLVFIGMAKVLAISSDSDESVDI